MDKITFNMILNSWLENSIPCESNVIRRIISNRKSLQRKRMVIVKSLNQPRRKIPKSKNFFQLIEEYPDDVFHSHFRMTRSTFKALQNQIRITWKRSSTGRIGLSLKKCLYVTIWKLSNRASFRVISDRFNIAKGTAFNIFIKTTKIICGLLPTEIKWPITLSEQKRIMEEFQSSRKDPFPFVVGCVDGTHIKIPAPKNDPSSYYDRKGNYSIIVQGICDSKFRFIDVFVGYPGSCHDANVWKNSPIGKAFSSGKIQLSENAHILGDSAYPLSSFMMVPYRDNGHLTPEQKKFNYFLSSTRVCIEQTFGILRKKFQILEYIDVRSANAVRNIVVACLVLHNFILNREGTFLEERYHVISTDLSESNDMISNELTSNEDGRNKRENLTMLFAA